MQAANLTGATLDYWTGRADGIPAADLAIQQVQRGTDMICVRAGRHRYDPSTNWAVGGPIIDKLVNMGFGFTPGKGDSLVNCSNHRGESLPANQDRHTHLVRAVGPDVLVAACRAYVAAIFGGNVSSIREEVVGEAA